jgi:hemerythrin-like domain-containing protein
MSGDENSRRNFLKNAALIAGSAFVLNSCGGNAPPVNAQNTAKKEEKKEPEEKEVTAAEDLMREHGILRRALVVYTESAVRLRKNASAVPPDALQKTARLFRSFGEDYHEKLLEEAFIFPVIKQKGGEADVLTAQHNRGREITDYIISQTNGVKIGANAGALADLFDNFVRMYETHAAREDTIVFPAWKDAISDGQYKELSDKFEDIEHQTFGEDGFETAVKQIAEIESALKLTDIAQFTAPAPPVIK